MFFEACDIFLTHSFKLVYHFLSAWVENSGSMKATSPIEKTKSIKIDADTERQQRTKI